MLKRCVTLASLIGLAWAVAAPATASVPAKKTKHELTVTYRIKQLGFEGSGSIYTGVFEADFDGGKVRKGAVESRGEFTDTTEASVLRTKGTDRLYFLEGSIHNTNTGTITLNPDGSATTTFEGVVDGGSGAFRGATGKLAATCSNPVSVDLNSVTTCEGEGTISY